MTTAGRSGYAEVGDGIAASLRAQRCAQARRSAWRMARSLCEDLDEVLSRAAGEYAAGRLDEAIALLRWAATRVTVLLRLTETERRSPAVTSPAMGDTGIEEARALVTQLDQRLDAVRRGDGTEADDVHELVMRLAGTVTALQEDVVEQL